MNTFFIADPHFGDDNIIKYENRPFADAAKMDAMLIKLWNDVVSEGDRVFVLGDLSGYGFEKTKEIISSLNGSKTLIKGNHDTGDSKYYLEMGFESVSEYPVILDGFWILSHEPMYINDNMPYANIYGHVHGNQIYKDYSLKSYCVSVERTGYKPVLFEEIKIKTVE